MLMCAVRLFRRNMNKSDKVYVITIVEEVHPHLPNTPYFAKMKEEMNATLHEKAKAHLKEFANMCIERQVCSFVVRFAVAPKTSWEPFVSPGRGVVHGNSSSMSATPSQRTAQSRPSASTSLRLKLTTLSWGDVD